MNFNALYNRAEAIERLGGDEALYASVASLFVESSAGYCAALAAALQAGDAAALRREAHTIKSMLATFSFEAGRVLALRLEELAAAGDLARAQSLTDELIAAIGQLVEALAAATV